MPTGPKWLHPLLGVGAIACALASTPTLAAGDILKMGVIQPQAGDCAQWGVPITRGVELWADEMNEQGGILAGDGERHEITVGAYDNICYVPGEEIKAARRAVLDDGVKFLLQTYTPLSRQAVADLVTENEVLTISYGAGYLSPDYPFLMGGITGSPTSYMLLMGYILESHPEVKRVAIITSDNSPGLAAKAYYEAGVAPYADRVEIVYNESYSDGAASDMLGLMTPVMDAKPDLIVELGLKPAEKAVMIEVADQFGYKGLFGDEGWDMSFILDRVPLETVAGRLISGYAMEASEPTFSKRAYDFYKRYVDKYGEKEWSVFAAVSYAAMCTIEAGLKASPSVDAATVMTTLYGMESVDHPIFGPSAWGGADIFGANYHLLTPLPMYNVGADGKFVVEKVLSAGDWWAKHRDAALPKLEAGGQVFLN